MTKLIFSGVFCVISFLPSGAAGAAENVAPFSDTGSSSGNVVATVNGKDLTISDLQNKHGGSLFQAKNTYYQSERKALDDLIDNYLLEEAARRENVTVAELLDRHVTGTIAKDPNDEALKVYYEGLDTNQPFEDVRGKILEHIRDHRIEKARANYLQSLKSQARIAILLTPPRADVNLKNTPVRGATKPEVTVIEFADYECPYCQQVHPDLKRLETEFSSRVAFAFKDTPLPMHSHAEKAAEAAHCAGLQGKFWEYHDALFTSKQLDVGDLKEDARQLNLNAAAFDKCLDSGEQAELVKTQLSEAQRLGLSGTPSFFVNGRFLSGAVTYTELRDVVNQELAAEQTKQTAKR